MRSRIRYKGSLLPLERDGELYMTLASISTDLLLRVPVKRPRRPERIWRRAALNLSVSLDDGGLRMQIERAGTDVWVFSQSR